MAESTSDLGESGSHESRASSGGADPVPSGVRTWLKRAALLLVVALGLGGLAAVTGFGMAAAVPYALQRFGPDGWSIRVGNVEGSWLDRVELTDLTVEAPTFRVDAARLLLRYDVRPLFSKRLEIEELVVEEPVAQVEVPDTASAAEPDTASSILPRLLSGRPTGAWAVLLDAARLTRGRVQVQSGGRLRYDLSGLELVANGSVDGDGLAVRVDTAGASFLSIVPDSAGSGFRSEGRVALRGELREGRLTLDTLALVSDRSRVAGGGHVTFVDDPELWGGADLRLTASPLDLRDLPATLPEAILRQPDVYAELSARGVPDSLVLALDGRMTGGASMARADVVLGRSAGGGEPFGLRGHVRLEGVDVGPWSAPPLDGTAGLSADFSVDSIRPGAAFHATGSVRHDPRVADSTRVLTRPILARFEADGALAGDTAAGPSLPTMNADVILSAGSPGVDLGSVSVEARGSTILWVADLALDGGTVEGEGRATWAPELLVETPGVTFAHLNLASVDTTYPSTDLTGHMTGRLQGAAPSAMKGLGELFLSSSRYAEVTLDTLALSAEIDGTSAAGTLLAATDMGKAQSLFAVDLVDSVVEFEVDELMFVREVAEVAPDTAEAGIVALYGSATGRWALSDVRAGDLIASVDSAGWGSVSVRGGRVDARLRGERIEGDADLTAEGLLPSPLLIRGRADVTGLTLETITGRVGLSVAPAAPDSLARLDTLYVEVVADEPGLFALDGAVQPTEGGRIEFEGTAGASGDSLSFDIVAGGRWGGRTALVGGATLDSLYLTASGRRIGQEWETLRTQLVVEDGAWRGLQSDRALASVVYDSSGLRVDTLDVRTNVFAAFGQGRLPAGGSSGSIEVTAEILDLDPLREPGGFEVLAAGEGTARASLAGSLDSIAWQADLGLEALVVNQLRMTGVRFTGEGMVAAPYDRMLGLSSSDMLLSFDRILLPSSEVRRVSFAASGGADSLRVEAEAVVDDARHASMSVHVDPRPEGRTARIEDVRFQIDEDQWRLVDEAVLQYSSGISVQPVLLRAGEQEIRLEGGVSGDGALDLNARMDSTDVATVADLVGLPRLRGWLSGRVRVQGTTDSPEAWLDIGGALHREGRRPGPVQVRVRGNGRRIRGELELSDANRGALRLTGGGLMPGVDRGDETGQPSLAAMTSAPPEEKVFGLVSDSLDVTVEADAFDLRWTEAFFTAEQLASLSGRLDGSLRLSGSSDDPDLTGAIRLRDGAAYPTALGVRYDAIGLTVRGAGTALVVDSARVSGSAGVATALGTIESTGNMPLDLAVDLDGFRAIRTDAYWAVVSGSMNVKGVAMAPVIDGELRIESLDVFLDERVTSGGLEPVELTEEDLRMLRERFGIVADPSQTRRALAERITADISVELGRDSWLRKRTSPEMAVPFSGTMQVELRPGALPLLQGSVDVIAGRGFVEQFGRRFELSAGTVTFNGTPAETRVDLEATYTIPSRDNPDDAEVTIILDVAGTQEDLSLTLSSNPPLENADIVSYIATGRPAAGSLSFEGSSGGGGLVAAGADFALSQMTSLIETAAAGSVGLDVVEIRREGLRQATLVAGKYVTPRLYVGFAQPISLQEGDGLSFGSEGRSELEIEYEAWRWLLLNVEGSGSSVRFFLRGRRAY